MAKPIWKQFIEWLRRSWLVIPVILVILFAVLAFIHRESLAYIFGYGKDGISAAGRFFRDALIAMGAILGLFLAGWRNVALSKQAKAADTQAQVADKRHGSEALSRGMELLAKENEKGEPAIEARIGGIYTLASLAGNDEAYREAVMKTLVAYICRNAQITVRPVRPKRSVDEMKQASSSPEVRDRVRIITDPDKRAEAAPLGEDVKSAFAELKKLDEQLGTSKIPREELNFANADFRALNLNEIKWIKEPCLTRVDLRRACLEEANLTGANLVQTNLNGANLWAANLNGANLWVAILNGANLIGTNLNNANLGQANLTNANLVQATLTNANLVQATLNGAHLMGTNLNNANLGQANLTGTNLKEAYLTDAHLMKTNLNNANLIGTNLTGAVLWKADLTDADLRDANLAGANLKEADLTDADLRDANLAGADLEGGDLTGAEIEMQPRRIWYTNFIGAKFGALTDYLEKKEKYRTELEKAGNLDKKQCEEKLQWYFPLLVDKEKKIKIWHSGQDLLKGIESSPPKPSWLELPEIVNDQPVRFKPIEARGRAAVLAGILRNFGEPRPGMIDEERVQDLRREARQLCKKSPALAAALPKKWQEWLREEPEE